MEKAKTIDWLKEAAKIAAESGPDPNPSKKEVVYWAALQQAIFEIKRLSKFELYVLHIEDHFEAMRWEGTVICELCSKTFEEITGEITHEKKANI